MVLFRISDERYQKSDRRLLQITVPCCSSTRNVTLYKIQLFMAIGNNTNSKDKRRNIVQNHKYSTGTFPSFGGVAGAQPDGVVAEVSARV